MPVSARKRDEASTTLTTSVSSSSKRDFRTNCIALFLLKANTCDCCFAARREVNWAHCLAKLPQAFPAGFVAKACRAGSQEVFKRLSIFAQEVLKMASIAP